MSQLSSSFDIVLIGFMGAGKTEVGKEIAARVDYAYVDLDSVIVERAGKSIEQIFADEGEARFRQWETEALKSLGTSSRRVVATGGGIVGSEQNWPLLKALGPVIFLRARFSTLIGRIGSGEGRPLAQGDGRVDQLKSLLESRKPFYERADVIVDTDELSPAQVAISIIDELKRVLNFD